MSFTPTNYFKHITALFWAITQRVVTIPYRRFGTTYWLHLQGPRIQESVLNVFLYAKYLIK